MRSLLMLAVAVAMAVPSASEAGLFDRGCDAGCDTTCDAGPDCTAPCGDACDGNGCGNGRGLCGRGCGKGDADCYRCKLEVDTEEVEKDCYVVKCEPVCVAPVSCDRSRGNCGVCNRGRCGSDGCCNACGAAMTCDGGCDVSCAAPCGDACTDNCDGGCGDGCGDGCGAGCGGGLKGLLSRLCGGGDCGRVRMVNKLSKDSQPNGERCTYKWSAEPIGGCGSCETCFGD